LIRVYTWAIPVPPIAGDVMAVDRLLDKEAAARGYANWIEAMRALPAAEPPPPPAAIRPKITTGAIPLVTRIAAVAFGASVGAAVAALIAWVIR